MATKAGALAAKPGNENACTKCGSKTRVIGRSQTPAALYLRCDGCGHVSVVPQAKR